MQPFAVNVTALICLSVMSDTETEKQTDGCENACQHFT